MPVPLAKSAHRLDVVSKFVHTRAQNGHQTLSNSQNLNFCTITKQALERQGHQPPAVAFRTPPNSASSACTLSSASQVCFSSVDSGQHGSICHWHLLTLLLAALGQSLPAPPQRSVSRFGMLYYALSLCLPDGCKEKPPALLPAMWPDTLPQAGSQRLP